MLTIPSQLRAREEPCRASHMTGCGVQGERLLENVCVSNILGTSSKHVGGNQCKEWALRQQELLLLLTQQEEAPLEDLDPICWRVNARFVVDRTQDVIFLRDHFLKCPSCMEQWNVVVGLAPREECCNSCEQVGQWASRLLRELVRSRIWKKKNAGKCRLRLPVGDIANCRCRRPLFRPTCRESDPAVAGKRVHSEVADDLLVNAFAPVEPL